MGAGRRACTGPRCCPLQMYSETEDGANDRSGRGGYSNGSAHMHAAFGAPTCRIVRHRWVGALSLPAAETWAGWPTVAPPPHRMLEAIKPTRDFMARSVVTLTSTSASI